MTATLDQALLSGVNVAALAGVNFVVNGFFNVSQENGDAAVAVPAQTTGTYQIDGIIIQNGTATGAVSVQRIATPFPSFSEITSGLKLTVTTAYPAMGANEALAINHRIEGLRIAPKLNRNNIAQESTAGFIVRSSIDTVIYLRCAVSNRAFLKRVVLTANVDTQVIVNVPADTAGNGMPSDNLARSNFYITICCGSALLGTEGVWQNVTPCAGADIGNFFATAGATMTFSGMFWVPGSTPIKPEQHRLLARPVDDELRLCQRYFRYMPVVTGYIPSYALAHAIFGVSYPAMRAAPTATLVNAASAIQIVGARFITPTALNGQFGAESTIADFTIPTETAPLGVSLSPQNSVALNARL